MENTINTILNSKQRKIFVMTFLAVFVMTMLQFAGVNIGPLTSPLPEKEDVFYNILPLLKEKKDAFSVKVKPQLFPKAHAVSAVDEASAYGVIDYQTGEVIDEKNLSKRVSIASLTKIMTAVVLLDLAAPEEEFTVTRKAAAQIPTKIVLTPGEKLTVEELLNAGLLTSANDAVEVIRDGIDAKYEKGIFIRAMNEKARIIGLKNTNFENPQGFDSEDHYSTVEDMTLLTHYALTNYPIIKEISKKDYEFLPANTSHKEYDLYNWNGLIGVYPGASGVKIGNTEDAGRTTVVTAERDGKEMIVVVLGAPGIKERDMWAAELLDLGFSREYGLEPVEITEEALQIKYDSWEFGR